MALYYGYMGDVVREEKLYCEASAANPTLSTPWFNLALLMHRQKRFDEAKHAIDMAIRLKDSSAPYYVLQAQIVRDMGRAFAKDEFLKIADKRFNKLADQDDWELGWYITASDMRDDKPGVAAAKEERSRRKAGTSSHVGNESLGLLPSLAA